eukprot:CAMPEP_0179460594 /NCGR_PEP_ID=MMETSP0799-20121207/43588_1 /TAXON_ID=46947 /ORGANISM="Geminigera cryophila, Strain CCMP2564" /LENGTH=57 /DNA_ID=CAMNT_0021262889 /DNA_START=65 /DNA_END=235 /DNA_ORIENTATION=+
MEIQRETGVDGAEKMRVRHESALETSQAVAAVEVTAAAAEMTLASSFEENARCLLVW